MIRFLISLAALLSPFLFPYPATLLLSFVASLYLPWIAVAVGALTEASYGASGAHPFPLALLLGALLTLIALLVRRFVASNIMQ